MIHRRGISVTDLPVPTGPRRTAAWEISEMHCHFDYTGLLAAYKSYDRATHSERSRKGGTATYENETGRGLIRALVQAVGSRARGT